MVETAQVVGSPEAETEEKPIKMAAATIWCDKTLLKELKAAVKLQGQGRTLVDELNELFRRRLAEFRGIEVDPNSAYAQATRLQHYESVKKRQFELHQEQLKMLKFFEDQKILGEVVGWYVQATTGKPTDRLSDNECWDIILETVDNDQEFRHQVCKFLAANPKNSFVYDFVNLLERIREKRKLQRQMLQFQAESLGKEEYDKLEQEERLKREEEAKAQEQKCVEEVEREEASKRREGHQKRLQETIGNNGGIGEELQGDDKEEDTEESDEDWNDEEE